MVDISTLRVFVCVLASVVSPPDFCRICIRGLVKIPKSEVNVILSSGSNGTTDMSME